MITIPLYVILFIYLGYLAVVGIFSFINFSHLFHSGSLTLVSFFITLLVAALAVTILYFTFIFLNGVDWQQPLTLWNNDWISNALNSSNFKI